MNDELAIDLDLEDYSNLAGSRTLAPFGKAVGAKSRRREEALRKQHPRVPRGGHRRAIRSAGRPARAQQSCSTMGVFQAGSARRRQSPEAATRYEQRAKEVVVVVNDGEVKLSTPLCYEEVS